MWTIRDPDTAAVRADPAILDGKIVINISNRDDASEVQDGGRFGTSLAETFQAHATGARVVKALNRIAMETLDTSPAALRAAGAQAFIAGDDATAKQIVAGLLSELGFHSVDLGTGPVAMRAAEASGDVIRLLMIGQRLGSAANLQLRMLPPPDLGSTGARGIRLSARRTDATLISAALTPTRGAHWRGWR